jgi:hypothetical protein
MIRDLAGTSARDRERARNDPQTAPSARLLILLFGVLDERVEHGDSALEVTEEHPGLRGIGVELAGLYRVDQAAQHRRCLG